MSKEYLLKYLKLWFGDFKKEELKKYISLGLIFAIVIGVYWTLRPIKDTIFCSMVHNPESVSLNPKAKGEFLIWAKILSLVLLFPIVILYSKAVERFKRQYMFYFMGALYSILILSFGLYFKFSTNGLLNITGSPFRITGWLWYVFVESYGSLMVALFWAFAADISNPESAKKGFAITVMIGQLGAILGPLLLTPLGKNYFSNSAPVVILCSALNLLVIIGLYLFMRFTPKEQLVGFHGIGDREKESTQEPGFFEGLKLLFTHTYLIGIFSIIAIYEILITIIDFNFKSCAMAEYSNEAACTAFLGDYAVWVNFIAFLCILFGINNIQRFLGVRISLLVMPVLMISMMGLFLFSGNLTVLFYIMVALKAINYAINGPTMKQLYVPTTKDVKYKSQAWIETFGSRGSKACGSLFNLITKVLGTHLFVLFTGLFSLILSLIWYFIASYVGKKYQKAVKENKVVC